MFMLYAVIALVPVSSTLLHQIILLPDINVPVGDNSSHKDLVSSPLIRSLGIKGFISSQASSLLMILGFR